MTMRKRRGGCLTAQSLSKIDAVLDIGDMYRCEYQMTALTVLLNFFHLT